MLQKIVRSTVIDAPIERVWEVLRDFNSHDRWHPAIASSSIEGGERSDQVGCIRNFKLQDGNHIREQLIALSDTDHVSTYCIVQSTVPLQRYVATVTLKRITDGNRTMWHWESSFATPPGQERSLGDLVAKGVYEAGFEGLRRYLLGNTSASYAVSRAPMRQGVPVASRQVQISRFGDASVLQIQTVDAPAPAAGQVRIAQRAVGVNFFDIYVRKGWVPGIVEPPAGLGMEAVGTVLDVGDGVGGLLSGDRVAYLCPQPGSYCSVRTVSQEHVVRLPASVEDNTAAALLLKGITVDYLLRDLGRIQKGTRILVHAAAGGVGLLLCSWARSMGATVMGTVSSEAKARLAREYGCEHVIVTPDYKFADAVQRLDGAQVIVDGLGDAARTENMAAIAATGHWISLGQASGPLAAIDPGWLNQKSVTLSRPVVFHYTATQQALAERAARVWAALESGALRRPPIEQYSLNAAGQTHERMESRQSAGSLILTV
ncbi:SRPBCC family protein [Variovorax sp. PCZ-1]|uniref:SRPBCC family protein n=1 Tax=Variovorax sp. PCZ-1 TaxID=2835533 RepID=UPI001BCFAFEE|nr:SRPBCC family protein [Variovorax sp. PCZ-1]MBS7806035.1 SRPBCC family protein [Variovorax sp. PCZ-1]